MTVTIENDGKNGVTSSFCSSLYIVTWLSDYRRGLDWWHDLLHTLTHDSWLHFTIHCYTHTSVLGLLQFPVVVAW
jgi:hypothetical protein